MPYIYKITNNINDKVYIGQTINDPLKRWQKHLSDAKEKRPYPLYYAMNKYGIENFSFEVIEECPFEILDEREIFFIKKFNSYINNENSRGYNATLGGKSSTSLYFTPNKEEVQQLAKTMTINQLANYYDISYYTMKNYLVNNNISYSLGSTGGGKRQIAQIDIKTQEIIKIYSSIAEASRAFNKIPKNSAIRDVLRNKCKTAYGFAWKYV